MSDRSIRTIGVAMRSKERRFSLGVAMGLAVAPLVALALARFAYALLLPAMRADLNWSYAQAGAMNTTNAGGYLLGAIVTAHVSARLGERLTFLIGIFGTAVSLLACGVTASLPCLLLSRFTAGFCGALAFVVGAALVARAGSGSSRNRQALLIGVYFGGGGLGIALSSLIVPIVLSAGQSGWRWGWFCLGAASALAGFLALPALRSIGRVEDEVSRAHDSTVEPSSLLWMSISYLLFGAGYIAYMTFIVAFLRAEGFDANTISAFWTVLGFASVAAGFCWGPVLARFGGGWPMVLVLVTNICGALAPLIVEGKVFAFVSAVLFGASLMAAPSAVTAFVRRVRPPAAWTASIGRLTVLFGLGQCIGPLLAGSLSDSSAGIRLGLFLSVGILMVAALSATMQREPTRT